MEFKPERERVREPKEEDSREIKEIVDKIERVYEENKEKEVFRSRPIRFLEEKLLPQVPEIQPKFLEKVLQGIIERYRKKEYISSDLGPLLSCLTNRTVKEYIRTKKAKGKKPEDIEPLKLTLDTQNLPEPLQFLGYRNQEKCLLIIKGDAGNMLGQEMTGGEVLVEGNGGERIGAEMKGGEIRVGGGCKDEVGLRMKGGKITIGRYCEGCMNACEMKGGTIIFQGGLEKIAVSAFTDNRGEILVRTRGKLERIWPIIIPLDELRRR